MKCEPFACRVDELNANTEFAMQNAFHFVGFKDDRVFNALRVFGAPDFWHRIYDARAVAEICEGDMVLVANGDETQPVREFTHDDSQMF